MQRAQYTPCDSAKIRPCTLDRHQAPSLPPPEGKGLPRQPMRLFTDHDELLSLIIFHEKSLYIHTTSLSVSAYIYRQQSSLHVPTNNRVPTTITVPTKPAWPASSQRPLQAHLVRVTMSTAAAIHPPVYAHDHVAFHSASHLFLFQWTKEDYLQEASGLTHHIPVPASKMKDPISHQSFTSLTGQVSITTRATARACDTRAAMPVSFHNSLLIFSYAITNRVCGPEHSKCSTAHAIHI